MGLRLWLLVILASALLLPSCSREPPASSAGASVADPASATKGGGRLYVTNEISGDLSVIDVDTRRVVDTLPLGKRPRGIKRSPDGSTLYVALSGSPISPPGIDVSTLPPADKKADGIGVFDVRQQRLLRVIPGGSDPEQLAVSQDGRRLFVANEDVGETRVIEASDGRLVAVIPVGGEPEGIDLRPDGNVVYVTSEEDNEIFVIDAVVGELITKFAVGPRPRSTGFLPDSSRAYISSENGASVTVVNAMTHQVIHTIDLAGKNVRPMGIIASPDGTHVFVTTGRGKTVVMIETATDRPVGSVEVGERPWGIAISPDGRTVYTANGPSNDVSFVDVASRMVTARVKVGDRPWGIVHVP